MSAGSARMVAPRDSPRCCHFSKSLSPTLNHLIRCSRQICAVQLPKFTMEVFLRRQQAAKAKRRPRLDTRTATTTTTKTSYQGHPLRQVITGMQPATPEPDHSAVFLSLPRRRKRPNRVAKRQRRASPPSHCLDEFLIPICNEIGEEEEDFKGEIEGETLGFQPRPLAFTAMPTASQRNVDALAFLGVGLDGGDSDSTGVFGPEPVLNDILLPPDVYSRPQVKPPLWICNW